MLEDVPWVRDWLRHDGRSTTRHDIDLSNIYKGNRQTAIRIIGVVLSRRIVVKSLSVKMAWCQAT